MLLHAMSGERHSTKPSSFACKYVKYVVNASCLDQVFAPSLVFDELFQYDLDDLCLATALYRPGCKDPALTLFWQKCWGLALWCPVPGLLNRRFVLDFSLALRQLFNKVVFTRSLTLSFSLSPSFTKFL